MQDRFLRCFGICKQAAIEPFKRRTGRKETEVVPVTHDQAGLYDYSRLSGLNFDDVIVEHGMSPAAGLSRHCSNSTLLDAKRAQFRS
jgi:hypothetical protein